MKTIEETHPSLANLAGDVAPIGFKIKGGLLLTSDVQEHTIDKAILKKSINKCFDVYNQYNVKIELLKELGLEEK